MKHEIMEVEKERFSLKDSSQYLVQGTWAAEYVPEVFLDIWLIFSENQSILLPAFTA